MYDYFVATLGESDATTWIAGIAMLMILAFFLVALKFIFFGGRRI